ncbi:MAG: flagellar basal body-associated FliL family protein [Gemmatimonadales bacterium]|nr:flagellar basal body-associated FliL family protein [Gemmatimonadales bacterium]MDZ4388954.1 flagellar basal body-associated FliL family protein [Gemmatimonadales bacterium]
MAESAAATTEAAPPRGGMILMLAVGVVALGVGLGAGRLVLAPRLSGGVPAAEAAEASGGGGHGAGEESKTFTYTLDGLIVNPAGSRGQHHVILSVAIDAASAADQATLRSNDMRLRDQVASLLEQRTLEQLSAAGIRETLRSELVTMAEALVPGRPVHAYIPQYIVQ